MGRRGKEGKRPVGHRGVRGLRPLQGVRPGSGAGSGSVDLHPLEGPAQRALEALREVVAFGEAHRPLGLPGRVAEVPAPDALLQLAAHGKDLVTEARTAAEALLRHVLDREEAPSAEELDALATRLEDGVRAAVRALGASEEVPNQAERERATAGTAELLREIGLERLDVELEMGARGKKGSEAAVVAARKVEPTTAHVLLLPRLFQRVETMSTADELVALERAASVWWFHRHSAPSDSDTSFGQAVREGEWSLVERETLSFGAPLLDVFLETSLLEHTPPRQRALVRALQASFAGAFVVRERSGTSAVYEELLRRRRFEVYEHSDEIDYEPGWVGLGRILAFDGPLHLRSPGMFFAAPDEGLHDVLDETFRGARVDLPAAILVELVFGIFRGVRDLPRQLSPAGSPGEAAELADALSDALMERGLAKEIPGEPTDPALLRRMRASGAERIEQRRLEVDDTVGDWMRALSEFSRSRRTRRKAKKKGKG